MKIYILFIIGELESDELIRRYEHGWDLIYFFQGQLHPYTGISRGGKKNAKKFNKYINTKRKKK